MTGTTFTATPRTITWGANGGGFDIADAANTFTVAQPLIGGGGLTKAGTGTLILTGSNSYSGPATASGGKLVLFNATAFNSPATIASGATLAWSGNGGYVNGSTAATIALNSGGTLENLNPANYMVINGAVTISNTVNATAAGDRGFYLEGGLHGTGTVTINAPTASKAAPSIWAAGSSPASTTTAAPATTWW